jgi:hypothetical protein
MNRGRGKIASKSELEFRLAKLNWYLRRLNDLCDDPIIAAGAVSSGEQAPLLLLSCQLGARRTDARIGRRRGTKARLRRGH